MTLPRGLLDQPQRGRRQDRLHRRAKRSSAPADEAQCPEYSKVGTVDARQLGAAGADPRRHLPRRAAARQPLPALPHRRRLRDPRQARRHGRPGPADRAARGRLRGPAAGAVPEFNMHFFGSERGLLATPDPVRHLPGRNAPSCPGTRRSPNQTLDPVLHARLRPRRRALPERPAPVRARRSRPASPTTPPAPTRPSAIESTRPDGDQNLAGARRSRRRPASRDARGRPLLPRGGARRAREPERYAGLAEQRVAGLPGREPGRHRDRRRRRRHPPALPPAATSTSPAHTRARRSAWWSSCPRSPGPTTSATSSSAPRSTSTRPRPRSRRSPTRCRRSSTASRCGCARSRSTSTGPDFTLNPTNCDPFAVGATMLGDRRRAGRASSPHFQVANCANLAVRAEAEPEADRRPQAARPPGDPRDAAPPAPGEANIAPGLGHAAEGRAARQRPHRHALHPARSSPPTPARRGSLIGTASRYNAAARRSR